ncbi:hypothetical protein [Mangrovibacterium lignilyticum]|uniref:hypothetical protein n=1 Tax=Mangrovibacterium lignilyticum TaxID=2668052 RepID=UPI001EE5201D|nr:hypothetical protein [Mangrovibacterium lignilyticum]
MIFKNLRTSLVRTTLIVLTLFIGVHAFAQEKENSFKVGGALRFNVFAKSWVNNKTQPEFTLDTWRLNVDGSQGGVDFSFEYRFYPTFGTHFIHHGWLGYAVSDDLYVKLGVVQVPFGITKYASHSWWFQGQYYFGLEDDYDIGIKFDYAGIEKLDLSFAYFRQAEPEGPVAGGDVTYGNAGPGRYSYDITPGVGRIGSEQVDAHIRELNQFNARAAYHVNESLEFGASAQVGGIYNSVLDQSETSTAFALHMVANWGKGWNFKGSFINYNYKAKSDDGRMLDIVQMGAYGTPYDIAAKANAYSAGIAKSFDVDLGPIKNIQAYVDYTLMDKIESEYANVHHLIPGILVSAGPVYTYIDYAMGKNQPWLTPSFGEGMGVGDADAEWQKRFNINIGYYF